MDRLSIYFAAPLFNERERAFNQAVVDQLEQFACVFLPQRDGSLLADMIAAGVALPVAEARVFAQDREAVKHADILIAVLDGAHIDEGVAFELGVAWALGHTCVGFQTDIRRALPTGNNPMISGGLHKIFQDAASLVTWVRQRATSQESVRQAV